MITLLRKLFIKDYQNVHDPKVREEHGILSSVFGIVTNFILVVLKAAAAIILALPTGGFSVALIADAVNNLTDMASSVVSLIGFKVSNKPADADHPFGHGRVEYIAGLIVSMVVVLVAVELFKSSLEKAIDGTTQSYDIVSMVILGIAILLKLFQGYFNYTMGKIIESPTLKATSVDSLTDSLATTAVLVSAILTYTLNWGFLDAYLGMAVSIFVLIAGIRMIVDTSKPLLGEAAKKSFVQDVVDYAMTHKGIQGVHDVLVHNYGPNKSFISFHAEIDAKMDILEAHDLIDNLEDDIRKKFGCEISIHMDPILIGDKATDQAKEKCLAVLKGLDEKVTLHDFRLVSGPTHMNMIFDILIPFESKVTLESAFEALKEAFKDNVPKVNFVVKMDRPFDE